MSTPIKGIACLVLCLMLAAGCMLGAGAQGADFITAPGEMPIVTNEHTIVIGTRAIATITDYDDNELTNRIRKDTGVNVEMFLFDNSEYKTQLQLMTTSGEKLPDTIWAFPLTAIERESYGAQGYFIPLNEYFDEESSVTHFFKKASDDWLNDAEKAITIKAGLSSDGNLYGFPFWAVSVPDPWSIGLLANNTFLDALDMDLPQTIEDLYNYLVGVRDNDPNGNGKNDEIPLIGFKDSGMIESIMNAFTYYPNSITRLCADDNGQLYAPYVLDEYKAGLAFLNQLYTEGLLSDLTFSQDRYALQAMTDLEEDADDIVGMAASHRSYMFASHSTAPKRTHFTTLGVIEGPEGVAYASTYPPEPGYYNYVTADCEYPEIPVRMLDYMTTAEMTLCARYGLEGVHWDWATEEQKAAGSFWSSLGYSGVLYSTANKEVVWGQQNNVIWNTTYITWQPQGFTAVTPITIYENPISQYNTDDWNGGIKQRYGQAPDNLVGSLAYTAEEVMQLGTSETDLYTYANECATLFILGEMSLERDWDTYLATLEGMNLEGYLAIAQASYDRAYK